MFRKSQIHSSDNVVIHKNIRAVKNLKLKLIPVKKRKKKYEQTHFYIQTNSY